MSYTPFTEDPWVRAYCRQRVAAGRRSTRFEEVLAAPAQLPANQGGRTVLALASCLLIAACGSGPSELPADAAFPATDASSDSMIDSGGGTAVTVTTYRLPTLEPGDTANTQFMAIQDGDGAWQPLVGTNGVYGARVRGPRYSIAAACVEANPTVENSWVTLVHTTVAERTEHHMWACNAEPPASVPLRITLQNTSSAVVVSTSLFGALVPGSYEWMVMPHRSDLAVVHQGATGVTGFRLNDVELTTPKSFTMDVAQGAPLDTIALSLPPLAADEAGSLTTSIHRDKGTGYRRELLLRGFGSRFTPGMAAPTTYLALGAALRRPGDLEQIIYSNTATRGFRRAIAYTDGRDALTIALPDFFEPPAPALTQTPYTRPTFAFAPISDDQQIAYVLTAYSAGRAMPYPWRYWSADISQGWIEGASAVQYTMPDLSGLPGWSSDFELREHDGITWNVARHVRPPPMVGSLSTSAGRTGVVGEYCGDGIHQAWEVCDDGHDTAACDSDCTVPVCGDGYQNDAAGEGCDPPDGILCSPTCVFLGGRASSDRAPRSPREVGAEQLPRREAVCAADPFADDCQD